MGKVVKGALLAGAIYLTGGAAAALLPNALMTGSFLGAYFTAVSSLAASAVLSGIGAQIAGKPKSARAETRVEYAGTVEPRRLLYGENLVSGPHLLPRQS